MHGQIINQTKRVVPGTLQLVNCPIFEKDAWNLTDLDLSEDYGYEPKANMIAVADMTLLNSLVTKEDVERDVIHAIKRFWAVKSIEMGNASWDIFAQLYVKFVRLPYSGSSFFPDPKRFEVLVLCPGSLTLQRSIGFVIHKQVFLSELASLWESFSIETPEPGTEEKSQQIDLKDALLKFEQGF